MGEVYDNVGILMKKGNRNIWYWFSKMNLIGMD